MKETMDRATAAAWIDRFLSRAKVMREIQSGKAQFCRSADLWHTLAVLVLGALITFLGFTGTDRLSEIVDTSPAVSTVEYRPAATTTPNSITTTVAPVANPSPKLKWKPIFDFAFNIVALLLFVTSLLNLVFRWKEDHQALFQGVKRLTQYMHWLDEIKLRLDDEVDCWVAKEVRLKYQVIVEQLPPNSEKDYVEAKARLERKAV
jgi:uncharacterized protein